MSLEELRERCVEAFSDSSTRAKIMDGFVRVVRKLVDAEVDGELWVNGSFLTEKIDPEDIDFILRITSTLNDNADESQREAIDFINDDLREEHYCHCFVHTEYEDENDPDYWIGEYMRSYWMRQWGFSRDEKMKGIAVIQLTERESIIETLRRWDES